jgi:hypothetical protein
MEMVREMGDFLLSVIYYLVVTPLGLATRFIHDPLSRRPSKRAATYWTSTGLPGRRRRPS